MLDVIQRESVPLEETRQGCHREVAQMLVVDRVKLAVVDQILNVRDFDDDHTVFLQEDPDTFHEPVEVGDVGQDVVGDDHVRSDAFVAQPRGQLITEEGAQGPNPGLLGNPGRSLRRIDPKDRDAPLHEVLQHIPIVARELHDEAVRAELPGCDEVLGIPARMLQERVGH